MLRATDVQQIAVQRSRVNHETYRGLYADVASKIEYRAAMGEHTLRHVVPQLVPGRPAYDIDHAVQYVYRKLCKGGFSVDQPEPAVLDIGWAPTKGPKKKKTHAKSVADDRLAALHRVTQTAFGTTNKNGPPKQWS